MGPVGIVTISGDECYSGQIGFPIVEKFSDSRYHCLPAIELWPDESAFDSMGIDDNSSDGLVIELRVSSDTILQRTSSWDMMVSFRWLRSPDL